MQTMERVRFEVAGGLVVADPCYIDSEITESSRGIYYIEDASGVWDAEVQMSDEGDWGDRVASLTAKRVKAGSTVRLETVDLGVDAGQMSIIPAERTPLDYDALLVEHEIHEWKADLLSFGGGAVSSSGYGDGVYVATIEFDSWGPSKIKVVFIEEEEQICINCGDDATEENGQYCFECWWGEDNEEE